MTIWQFFDAHTFLALLAICFTWGLLVRILRMPVLLLRGWPPSNDTHNCDADGDWHSKADNEEKQAKGTDNE